MKLSENWRACVRTFCTAVLLSWPILAAGQAHEDDQSAESKPDPATPALLAPEKVEVTPSARHDEISQRLESIRKATGWFSGQAVRVEEGVVFLEGRTDSEQNQKWAGDLARNTQDVAAVVNRIEVESTSV